MAEDNSDGIICEHSASVYTIYFAGVPIETTVTRSIRGIEKWISEVPGTIFALETGLCDNTPATLHFCAKNQCLIIQLRHLPRGIPDSLRRFCNDEGLDFVGVDIDENIDSLFKDYMLEFVENVRFRLFSLELQGDWIKKKCKEQKDLVGALMEFYIMKTVNKARRMDIGWAEEVLDIKLVKQATIEAYVSYIIGCNLVT